MGESPRENPKKGFHSYPEEVTGEKARVRSESFADHYSQARQFYISQTPNEQTHLANALIFELSKVKKLAIRERMVAHLLNIDSGLAEKVIKGLRLNSKIEALKPAKPVNTHLKKSSALSILQNGPKNFRGRKLGVLLSDQANADLFYSLQKQVIANQATLEVIAPHIGGVELSDGSWIPAEQNIDGGPSVLYDAVALLINNDNLESSKKQSIRDFISDAFFHCKFIGYSQTAIDYIKKIGFFEHLDKGWCKLENEQTIKHFLQQCGELRYWPREQEIHEGTFIKK